MTTRKHHRKSTSRSSTKLRSKSLLLTACTCLSLGLGINANAQSPTQEYANTESRALDYMSIGDQYMLLGQSYPNTIGGYTNFAPVGSNNGRLHLQIVDPTNLSTISDHTYYLEDELLGMTEAGCTNMSVHFDAVDAKQTSNGGFIICGKIRSDAETGNCNTARFNNPFLLKVDAAGAVEWFKWYFETGNPNDVRFRSVVEDPNTGNFLVAGGYYATSLNGRALAFGTDMNGNPLWHHLMDVIGQSGSPAPTEYTEVTPYDNAGNTDFVFTGRSVEYTPSKGNILITTTDASGAILNNGAIESPSNTHYLEGHGVHDAKDGDVVITGPILDFSTGDWSSSFLKIDPLTLTVSVMKNISVANNHEFATSITTEYIGPFSTNRVFITGDDRRTTTSSLTNRGAFYLELDYAGNVNRYEVNNHANAEIGNAIIFDPLNGYPAYSSTSNTTNTSLTTDKYTGNSCATTVSVGNDNITVNDISTISSSPLNIRDVDEVVFEESPGTPENLICGMYKPGRTTGIQDVETSDKIVLSPNPAQEYINIQLPTTFKSDTKLKVLDISGRLFIEQTISSDNDLKVDISVLSSGMYILTVENNGVTEKAHFVKK